MNAKIPWGLVYSIFLFAATVALVFVRAFGSHGNGWNDILVFLPVLVGAMALTLMYIFIGMRFAIARDKRLARDHPDAIVIRAQMTPKLKKRLKSDPSQYATPELIGRTPNLFTTLADSDGISLWSGPASNPVKFWAIDWASVQNVRYSALQLQFKNAHGFYVDTKNSGADDALEIAPMPENPYALSYSQAHVEQLVDQLRELRATRQRDNIPPTGSSARG
jgi:hypothetical protein